MSRKEHNPSRLGILGIPVDFVDLTEAVSRANELIQNKGNSNPEYILAVNPEKIITIRKDKKLADFFSRASLLIPDGIGCVWAAKIIYGINSPRVTGVDLMQRLCQLAAQKGYRVFIFGSTEDVNMKAADLLVQRFPSLQIVGRSNGYRKPEEMEKLISQINESKAQILFIALGSPRQEAWIAQHSDKLNIRVIQGIGGTLDAITGSVKRAPVLWQRTGLEWFYRLCKQPSRYRRYFCYGPYITNVMLQRLKMR